MRVATYIHIAVLRGSSGAERGHVSVHARDCWQGARDDAGAGRGAHADLRALLLRQVRRVVCAA
eukprot:3886689-Pleurochrysis_carterae.AAC.1